MSKNAKNARRHHENKEHNRVKGFHGPAKTVKTNTKKKAWYQLKDANGRLLCLSANKGKKTEKVKKDSEDRPSNKKPSAKRPRKAKKSDYENDG